MSKKKNKVFVSKVQIELNKYEMMQKESSNKLNFTKLSSEFDANNYKTEYIKAVYPERMGSAASNHSVTSTTLSSSSNLSLIASSKSSLKPKISESNIKKLELIWAAITECCLNTTAHGLPNIFRLDNKYLKLMWIICFLASFAYCVYTISIIILSFISFDVLTNQQVLIQSPVEFPAITVCNINPFDRRNAQNYIDNVLLKNNISYVSDIKKIDINPKLVSNLIKASIKSDISLNTSTIQNLGFQFSYMILTCYFNNLPCNESDFIWRYDYDYTSCYTFNSGFDRYGNKIPLKQINEAGSDGGLKLELFLGDDKYQNQYILNSGARVVVHNQSIAPIIISEGVDVATGFQTNLGIKRSFLSKLDYPYSDCVKNVQSESGFDSFYFKSIFNILNMTTYRQKICVRLCLQDYIKAECNCTDGSLPNIYKNISICNTINTLNCVSSARIKYYNDSTASACLDCPLECDSASYVFGASTAR